MAEEFKDRDLNEEVGEGEVKDRGLFDSAHKKKEEVGNTPQDEAFLVTGVEGIHIENDRKEERKKEEEKKHGFFEKLHLSHRPKSSSSSSDEEEVEGEGGIKKKIKKKKEKKDPKEKLYGGEKKEKEEEKEPSFFPATGEERPAAVAVEKVDVFEEPALVPEEEKKGFLHKMKEKLPGHSKKAVEEGGPVSPQAPAEHVKEHEVVEGTEGKDKKGFLEKIMDKIPGYHKNAGEEAEKSPGTH